MRFKLALYTFLFAVPMAFVATITRTIAHLIVTEKAILLTSFNLHVIAWESFLVFGVVILISMTAGFALSFVVERYLNERNLVLAELDKERKGVTSYLNSVNDVVLVLNKELFITKANKQAKNFFKCELEGKNLINLFSNKNDILKINDSCLKVFGTDEYYINDDILISDDILTDTHVSMKISPIVDEMIVTFADISKRRKANMLTEKMRAKNLAIIKTAKDAIVTINSYGNIDGWNNGAETIFGYSAEEVIGLHVSTIIPDMLLEAHLKGFVHAVNSKKIKKPHHNNLIALNDKEEEFPINLSLSLWEDLDGEIYTTGIIRDVSDELRSIQKIESSLHEKNILLKELQHRTSNTLHSIISFMNLQSSRSKNNEFKELTRLVESRLTAMSSIYSNLDSVLNIPDIANGISAKSLLVPLMNNIQDFYLVDNDADVEFITNYDDIILSLKQAVPVGLIINEIITNSFRHAFAKDQKNKLITVSFSKFEENGELILNDNGLGIPQYKPSDNVSTFGLRLIELLVSELDGDMEVDTSHGTEYHILFPLNSN